MSTTATTLAYVMEQVAKAGPVSAKKMFGEYGLFLDGKMAGVICDDQLFVKPTPQGRIIAPDVPNVAPFPQAKPYLLIDGDRLEDREWVSALVRVTADALPSPKPRRAPKCKSSQ